MKRSGLLLIAIAGLMVAGVPAFSEGYRTEVGSGADAITIIVVKGTPYEMGHAWGSLMKDETAACLRVYLAKGQEEGGPITTDEKLDAAWASVSPYTDQRFKDELRGVAEGSGVPLEDLIRAHMLPVITPYACSGVAVWGDATANGHLYQIRNLDFTVDAGLQDYPVVVIYLPDEGIPHASPTFAGCVGANAGLNAEGIALSEKGASPAGDMPYNVDGEHFTTFFRDILYDAHNLDEAVAIVQNAKRFKKYRYWIGDGKNKKAVKMRAYAPELLIWADNDPTDEVAPNVAPNAVYYTMNNDLAFAHLTENRGAYNYERMIDLSRGLATDDGSLLNVVYDATALKMWVSYAQGSIMASKRTYVPIDLNDYLTYDATAPGVSAVAEAPRTGPPIVAALILGLPVLLLIGVGIWMFK